MKNSELEKQVQTAEIALASSQDSQNRAQSAVQKVIETLDVKIYDLSDLRQNLAKLLEDWPLQLWQTLHGKTTNMRSKRILYWNLPKLHNSTVRHGTKN